MDSKFIHGVNHRTHTANPHPKTSSAADTVDPPDYPTDGEIDDEIAFLKAWHPATGSLRPRALGSALASPLPGDFFGQDWTRLDSLLRFLTPAENGSSPQGWQAGVDENLQRIARTLEPEHVKFGNQTIPNRYRREGRTWGATATLFACALVTDYDSDRITTCSQGSRCGQVRYCDVCAYDRAQRERIAYVGKAKELVEKFDAFHLVIEPSRKSPFVADREWPALHEVELKFFASVLATIPLMTKSKAARRASRNRPFHGYILKKEVVPFELYPAIRYKPHFHLFVAVEQGRWSAEELIELVVQAVGQPKQVRRRDPVTKKCFNERVGGCKARVWAEPIRSEAHVVNLVAYLEKPIPVSDTYRCSRSKASTPDEMNHLNRNASCFLSLVDNELMIGNTNMRRGGVFHPAADSSMRAGPKVRQLQRKELSAQSRELQDWADELEEQILDGLD